MPTTAQRSTLTRNRIPTATPVRYLPRCRALIDSSRSSDHKSAGDAPELRPRDDPAIAVPRPSRGDRLDEAARAGPT